MDYSTVIKDFSMEVPLGSSIEDASRRLVSFNLGLDQAEEGKLFVPLPKEKPEEERNRSRLMTIRTRLFNLGYLSSDSKNEKLDTELEQAIRTFQKDAGLKTDEWVGEKTWKALSELVGFESSTNLSHWLASSPTNPALKRAVALRLFVLGLLENKHDYSPANLKIGMKNFGHVWSSLGFKQDCGEADLNSSWLSLLFDHDELVKKLVGSKVPELHVKNAITHSFLLNIAKVELWLAGYTVTPSGYDLETKDPLDIDFGSDDSDAYLQSSTLTEHFNIKETSNLYTALKSFWRDYELEKKPDYFLKHFPEFFTIIDKGLSIQKGKTEEEKEKENEERLEEFLEENRDNLHTIWDNVRKYGSRIWDGLKRAWGWLRRVPRRIKEIGINLSRIIYDFTLRAYVVAKNVLQSFSTSVEFLTNKYITTPSSPPFRGAIIAHDRDFDFRVFVDDSAPEEEVSNLSKVLTEKSKIFSFTCSMMELIISVAVDVIEAGVTGYLAFIKILLGLRHKWGKLLALADQYRGIFPEYA